MNRKDKYFRIVIIMLIIIILILLFFINFGKIEEKYLIPTGNVDVFDIDFNCDCDDKNDCSFEVNKGISNNTENVSIDDKEVIGQVFVDDDINDYAYQKNLHIFDNPAYEDENKIAPGVSNVYHFVVHNSTNSDIKYYIRMHETTEYKINLKYRLKKNNKYVVGNDTTWVTADEVVTKFSGIKEDSSDSYLLEWKWFDDDVNDTIAGENMRSEYKLDIRFYFESY